MTGDWRAERDREATRGHLPREHFNSSSIPKPFIEDKLLILRGLFSDMALYLYSLIFIYLSWQIFTKKIGQWTRLVVDKEF